MFSDIYQKRRVLLTGDTGFKGSHLGFFLQKLGAEVLGAALPMPGAFSHFKCLGNQKWRSEICDIRDREAVADIFRRFQPEIVFHLAAQPLVRLSYADPAGTFDTNVTGTVNVLEAVRQTPSVKAAVMITSDKCYENREDGIPCTENDPMGGFDPYSVSKGCDELLISAWRRSFFADGRTLIASARAGNVIGGGDWAQDRLIPDLMRGAAAGECAVIRNPDAVRPWQHVWEPLSGYLLLGEKLFSGCSAAARAWNFGPDDNDSLPVREIAAIMRKYYPELDFRVEKSENAPHEAAFLRLDCQAARDLLSWHGVWNIETALKYTALWYADFYKNGQINTAAELDSYIRDAAAQDLVWTK